MRVLAGLLLTLGLISSALAYSSWAGSSLYYAAGLHPNDQETLFSGLQSAGCKVLRVWLDGQSSGSTKGTNIQSYNSLEPKEIGQFDDTVLELLDEVMITAKKYGIKLMISMHSWNALPKDPYGFKYGTSGFYTNSQATSDFDNRLKHVLTHTHKTLGKQWKDLSEYIFAWEAENEAMIGLGQQFIQDHQNWQCDRATFIKSVIGESSGILVTTGGESWLDESMQPGFFSCKALDVVAIHAYGPGDFDTNKLSGYVSKAKSSGKMLIMQEWGACYYTTSNNDCPQGSVLNENTRSSNIINWAKQISSAGIPWMYWQILPNKDPHYGYDYEIGINDVNWSAFKAAANSTHSYSSPWNWEPYL